MYDLTHAVGPEAAREKLSDLLKGIKMKLPAASGRGIKNINRQAISWFLQDMIERIAVF